MICRECEKERKSVDDRGVCGYCKRSIRKAREHGRRKEREERAAADRRREILRPRTRSIQWLFEGAAGALCVQPTAGVPSMGDTVNCPVLYRACVGSVIRRGFRIVRALGCSSVLCRDWSRECAILRRKDRTCVNSCRR